MDPRTATSSGSSTSLIDTSQRQSQVAMVGTQEAVAHLPHLHGDPSPTPIPESTLRNGGFEQGLVAWTQYSSNGWPLILSAGDLPVSPHKGSWAAWLGGDDDEASILSQQIKLVPGDTVLHYWHYIASYDYCNPNYDIAGVLVDTNAVDAFLLCEAENTYGWRLRTVDLSAYGGQSVLLEFAAFTDDTLNSNLFIDDVALDHSKTSLVENEVIADRSGALKDGFINEQLSIPTTTESQAFLRSRLRDYLDSEPESERKQNGKGQNR